MDIVSQAAPMDFLYNIASIVLGIFAIVFAIHSLQVRGCLICATLSGSLCGLALLCQILELDRLAKIMDSSAIYDTVHARSVAGITLLAIVTALNLLALLRGRKQKCGTC